MRSARQVVPRSPEQGSQGDGKRTDLQQNQGKQEERAREGNVDGGNSRKLAGDNKENPQPQDDHLRTAKNEGAVPPKARTATHTATIRPTSSNRTIEGPRWISHSLFVGAASGNSP